MSLQCPECPKTYTSKSGLYHHKKRIHAEVKNFECDICHNRYGMKQEMEEHRRYHTRERPFKCSTCDNSYISRKHLMIHERRHTGEKPYKCSECDAAFSSSGPLRTHERIHTGERPYKCNVCLADFTQKTALNTHLRTHTNERIYKCEVCNTTYTSSVNLKVHMRTHTGEKPFQCPTCPVAFAAKRWLESHMRIHTGERPYKCNKCESTFAQSSALLVHKRRKHDDENRMYKMREHQIAQTLDSIGIQYKREHQIVFDCEATRGRHARIDFVIDPPGRIIFLECDEYQHVDYGVSCDVRRMSEVQESLVIGGNSVPIVWIRYNPDAFSIDGVRQKVPMKVRQAALIAKLSELSVADNLPPMSVHYMFYDTVGDRPEIFNDPSYADTFKELVV